ncbi:succinate dehydrogenase, hydrophobic membrane anchor protein [Roseiterribacter gracilis]|uniref:Succinate dehydrogenase hydrophobic membrane anchor subunit n=1 Tax=Roseiterribacter gracilis TaxID=2812848 RepID=A0A8S8XF58_9PROT|nr:succinate dehydrogenase membrane anchor subunit [Rhodospirillales bacterium TMPK1]
MSSSRIRSYAAPLARARGLGSAKEGVEHWWLQRLTALALVVLTLWFVWVVVRLSHATHDQALAFVAQPCNTVLLILTSVTSFWHAALGLQVVYEDYIGHEGARLGAIVLTKFAAVVLIAATCIAVLRIAFGVV